MSDTKISVEADVSGLTTANSAIVNSHKAVESSANKATAAINKMADAEARAQSRARTGAKSEAHRKFDEWSSSGARGTRPLRGMDLDEFQGGGWRRAAISESDARRYRDQVLRAVGLPPMGGGGGGGGGSGGGGGGSGGGGGAWSSRWMGSIAGALGGMVGGGNGGIGALLGGSIGGLIGRINPLAGMVAGTFASRVGGAVDSAMDPAISEAIGVSQLRHALGGVTTGFDTLRESLRQSSIGLGISYDENVKLARQYAQTANLQAADAKTIPREVASAGGFARGYGLDPSQGVDFFGQMRRYKVTEGDADNRRLALMIADSIARGGNSAKADEVLQAVSQFTAVATRGGMAPANVEGFASMLASMTGLGIPGLDPSGAASMIGRADSAIRGGGRFGDASQNFSLGLYQRALPGFDAWDLNTLGSAGAMGTASDVFGPGSAMHRLAASQGDSARMGRYAGYVANDNGQTLLHQQLAGLRAYYGADSAKLADATRNHLGLSSNNEAAALHLADKSAGGLGGLVSSVGGDLGKMSMHQVATLAALQNGSRSDLMAQADKLSLLTGKDALSKTEREGLDAAKGQGDASLREMVLKLSATHDTFKDAGVQAQQSAADIKNAITDLASKLLPMVTVVKDGIVELIRVLPGTSARAFVEAQDEKKISTKRADDAARGAVESLDARIAKMETAGEDATGLKQTRSKYVRSLKDGVGNADHGEGYESWLNGLSPGDAPVSGSDGGRLFPRGSKSASVPTSDLEAKMAANDRALAAINPNWKPGMTRAQIGVESGFNPSAVSPAGAQGLAQIMPSTRRAWERKLGRPLNPSDPDDSLLMHRMTMEENLRHFGNVDDALSGYNGGWSRSSWANPETRSYAGKVRGRLREGGGDRLPSGHMANRASSGRQQFQFDHSVTLRDPFGVPLMPSLVESQVWSPTPAGVGG